MLEEKTAGHQRTPVEEDAEFPTPDADDDLRIDVDVELGLAAQVQIGAQFEELLIVGIADAVGRQRFTEEMELQQRGQAQEVQGSSVQRLLDVRFDVKRLLSVAAIAFLLFLLIDINDIH